MEEKDDDKNKSGSYGRRNIDDMKVLKSVIKEKNIYENNYIMDED